MASSGRILKVGIIGCGEIVQVAHISTLGFLSDYYQITYLCDVSNDALKHCQKKVIGGAPKITRDAEELCASPDVDVVIIANATEYHVPHALLALKHDKYAMVEKPLALTQRDADVIIEAEKTSKGRVFVAYMRRYATAFSDAIKEIGGLDKIVYARVRDIIGPNSSFVDQSGTFPKKFTDFRIEDTKDKNAISQEMLNTGLTVECGVPVTPSSSRMWMLLGGLGSHDLSVMREALGMPVSVLGASLGWPFWNVLFQYPGFAVSYESGIDKIPRFDAHIEIYSETKAVKVQYDSPYIKGLPTTMHISENVNGAYRETMERKTYEDAYTLELKELYSVVTENKPIKTDAEDAKKDLEIFKLIVQAGRKDIAPAVNGVNGVNGVH